MEAGQDRVLHLVRSSIQVGQSHVEQVVLQRIDASGNRQLHRVKRFVYDLLLQALVQAPQNET